MRVEIINLIITKLDVCKFFFRHVVLLRNWPVSFANIEKPMRKQIVIIYKTRIYIYKRISLQGVVDRHGNAVRGLTEQVEEVGQEATAASGRLGAGHLLLRSLLLLRLLGYGRRCPRGRVHEERALDAAHVVGQDGIATHLAEELLAIDTQRLALRLFF